MKVINVPPLLSILPVKVSVTSSAVWTSTVRPLRSTTQHCCQNDESLTLDHAALLPDPSPDLIAAVDNKPDEMSA